ncbi:MAG: Cof-type HAD-IIB family hydrolase [Clostridia bacterium]|nr:Cof-type HAD-IIB family hydrolase [Clostridia bacterium]
MANYDILFFDLDGTLLGPDHATVSPRNLAALAAAQQAGARLSFATGRCLGLIEGIARQQPFDYAVTSNGAAIYDLKANKQIFHHAFSPDEARLACQIIDRHVDFFELFVNGEILLTEKAHAMTATRALPPWHKRYFWRSSLPPIGSIGQFFDQGAKGLEKINLVECDQDAVARIREELEALGLYEVTSSIGSRALEVAPKGCSKGLGIRWLCERLGIDISRAAAFGDGGNDLEMLRTVGCGVAMGNAPEAVKAVADRVAAPYDQDGIAQFIEQYVL